MGRKSKTQVGDLITLPNGDVVEVLDYISCKKILVKNIVSLKEFWTRNEVLQGKRGDKNCKVKYSPRTKQNPPVKIGQRFQSDNHGECEVTEINGYFMTIKFLNTGAIKTNVYRSIAYSGKVADPSRGNSQQLKFKQEYAVGKVFNSELYGKYEIISNETANDISIKWLDTGKIQHGVKSYYIKNDSLRDEHNPDRSWNYLNCRLNVYYIYVVLLNGYIVYVGKGINKRYLHVNSGVSHNLELNRHYFCHDNNLKVMIHRYFESEEDCSKHEQWLINFLKPCYNSTLYMTKNTN